MFYRITPFLVLVVTLLAGSAVAAAQSQPAAESPDIFRIEISGCTHKPDLVRYQTGFRVSGVAGIVTALHGIVDGCESISAVSGGDQFLAYRELELIAADISADVALLSSDEAESAAPAPQLVAQPDTAELAPADILRVVGYPYGIFAQLSSNSLRVRRPALVPLQALIPPSLLGAVRERNSPGLRTFVVSVEGHFVPGHSGAPVFNEDGEVAGIVNGGLEGGNVEISWMVPWNNVFLEPVADPAVQEQLAELQEGNPLLVFSATEPDSVENGTATATLPATIRYRVIVLDATKNEVIEDAAVTLFLGGVRAASCSTDSDGYCALRVRASDQQARLLVEKSGYRNREREIEDLTAQIEPQEMRLSAQVAPAPLYGATQTPTPESEQPKPAAWTKVRMDEKILTGSSSDGYDAPPLGEVRLGGVPFSLPRGLNSFTTQTTSLPDNPERVDILNVQAEHPTTVYLLITGGNVLREFDGKKVGEVELRFDSGLAQTVDIIAGHNLREWKTFGNQRVTWLNDPNVVEVWRGWNLWDESQAVIDMLAIDVQSRLRDSTLERITVVDMSRETVKELEPAINILGVTVRSN